MSKKFKIRIIEEMIINKKDISNKNVLNINILLIEKAKEILFEQEIKKKSGIVQNKLFKNTNPWIGIIVI